MTTATEIEHEQVICEGCQKTLGTTPKCEPCHEWLLSREAEDVDEKKTQDTLERMVAWIEEHAGVGPGHFFKQVVLLYEMARDAVKGEYSVPYKALVMIIAALIYVLTPIDLIPDWILVVGWTDDAAVVAFTIKTIIDDLREYADWREVDLEEYGV